MEGQSGGDWKKLKIESDAHVIDIGCGGGQTVQLLSKIIQSGRITGLDYSQESIDMTLKRNVESSNKGIVDVLLASVSNLPIENGTYDVATAVQTHYFWPDLKNDIKEVKRILKDGGKFMIVSELYKMTYHMHEYKTVDELRLLFSNVGFKKIDVQTSNGWMCIVGIK